MITIVSELIEELKKYPQDMPVCSKSFSDEWDECYGFNVSTDEKDIYFGNNGYQDCFTEKEKKKIKKYTRVENPEDDQEDWEYIITAVAIKAE